MSYVFKILEEVKDFIETTVVDNGQQLKLKITFNNQEAYKAHRSMLAVSLKTYFNIYKKIYSEYAFSNPVVTLTINKNAFGNDITKEQLMDMLKKPICV